MNKSNLEAIRKIKQVLLTKGVSEYKSLESTIIQVLVNELGEKNELTKKAQDIKHGYIVPSAFSHISGLTTDIQYNQEQYKMYLDLLNEVEDFLRLLEDTDISDMNSRTDEIYNLFISSDKNAWETDSIIFDLDRCIVEYTENDLKDRFQKLGRNEIEDIKKFPCIFAYEDYCEKDASIGYITDIIVRQVGVKINFEKIHILPFAKLHELEFELDIRKWEFNRTHWAIKKVNLLKELQSLNINLKDITKNQLIDITKHFFDVSFTFAGESRDIVEQVVKELERIIDKNNIFYDNNYLSQLARPSLDTLLQDIYRNRSKLVVVFLCERYQDKKWCGLEFRAVRELIMDKEITKIMYIRLDAGHVDGVYRTDGYIDGTKFNPQQIANFINERLSFLE
jgi:hypothetical protein